MSTSARAGRPHTHNPIGSNLPKMGSLSVEYNSAGACACGGLRRRRRPGGRNGRVGGLEGDTERHPARASRPTTGAGGDGGLLLQAALAGRSLAVLLAAGRNTSHQQLDLTRGGWRAGASKVAACYVCPMAAPLMSPHCAPRDYPTKIFTALGSTQIHF